MYVFTCWQAVPSHIPFLAAFLSLNMQNDMKVHLIVGIQEDPGILWNRVLSEGLGTEANNSPQNKL